MKRKICLIPLGNASKAFLEQFVNPLREKFGYPVEIGKGLSDIHFAFNEKRDQFYSSAILDELEKNIPEDSVKVLGIVDEDLYVPSLNFVFGEAESNGSAAVISMTRLRQEFYGLKSDDSLFQLRVLKEAVHELGHCFGLKHCPNQKCVMHFSNSLQDTDIKSSNFCSNCSKDLNMRSGKER